MAGLDLEIREKKTRHPAQIGSGLDMNFGLEKKRPLLPQARENILTKHADGINAQVHPPLQHIQVLLRPPWFAKTKYRERHTLTLRKTELLKKRAVRCCSPGMLGDRYYQDHFHY